MMLPFRLLVGGPLGSGRQWTALGSPGRRGRLDPFALEHEGVSGPLNVSAPEPVRNREFARVLGRVMRRPSWAPAPAPVMRAVLGEMADMILTGQRAVPEAARGGDEFRHPDLEAALRDILER